MGQLALMVSHRISQTMPPPLQVKRRPWEWNRRLQDGQKATLVITRDRWAGTLKKKKKSTNFTEKFPSTSEWLSLAELATSSSHSRTGWTSLFWGRRLDTIGLQIDCGTSGRIFRHWENVHKVRCVCAYTTKDSYGQRDLEMTDWAAFRPGAEGGTSLWTGLANALDSQLSSRIPSSLPTAVGNICGCKSVPSSYFQFEIRAVCVGIRQAS